MNFNDLGNLVKNKYQEYSSLTPDEIGRRVADKHQVYKQKFTDIGQGVKSAVGEWENRQVNERALYGETAPTNRMLSQFGVAKGFDWRGIQDKLRQSNLPGQVLTGSFADKQEASKPYQISQKMSRAEPLSREEQGTLKNEGLMMVAGAVEPVKDVGKAPSKLASRLSEGFEDFKDLSLKSLKELEGKTAVNKQFFKDLANRGNIKQAERDLIRRVTDQFDDGKVAVQEFADRVKTELLPLETRRGASFPTRGRDGSRFQSDLRHESTTLPSELRGNVANYNEKVYQSPIKTSAGNIHFPSARDPIDNYFAHTRIEDLADIKLIDKYGDPIDVLDMTPSQKAILDKSGGAGETRRVIELQSDLFQKGRLELENNKLIPENIDYTSGERVVTPQHRLDRTEELSQLQPYRNTWHERLIKEEVKQASLDGKTKLQFPTGETAMKIEGLGENADNWLLMPKGNVTGRLRVGQLKTGEEIARVGTQDSWIITDVLEDGKFKAVQKDHYQSPESRRFKIDGRYFDWSQSARDYAKENKLNPDDIKQFYDYSVLSEQFDISGKVDTKNPIYRFYEKNIQKYLKKNYKAQTITDPQGVSWYELDLTPEQGRLPIEAFGVAPFIANDFIKEDDDNFMSQYIK